MLMVFEKFCYSGEQYRSDPVSDHCVVPVALSPVSDHCVPWLLSTKLKPCVDVT